MPPTVLQQVGKAQSGNHSCIIDVLESLSFHPASLFFVPYQKQIGLELEF